MHVSLCETNIWQYLGGSIALYPVSISAENEMILSDEPRTELFPEFPYKIPGHGPNQSRQQQCHIHQILEDRRGLLYAPDLGSDRVWIIRRDALRMEVCGWLACPPGTGARHAVFSPDGTSLQPHKVENQLTMFRKCYVCDWRTLAHCRGV